jgi:DNA-binding transcriptional MocR family regulator
MLAARERVMPPGTSWTQPRDEFFAWLTLPEGVGSHRVGCTNTISLLSRGSTMPSVRGRHALRGLDH